MARRVKSTWNDRKMRGAIRADQPDRFIAQHTAPLFFHRTSPAVGSEATFTTEEEFWSRCDQLPLGSVCLKSFRLSEWFPRTPGVYWSKRGVSIREQTELERMQEDPKLGPFFNPRCKGALIEGGGIGTVRLRPRRIDGTDCWLATAVAGMQCAGGVPLAIPDAIVRDERIRWGERVDLKGQVRFLQDAGLDEIAAHVHHAMPLIVFVNQVQGLTIRHGSDEPIVLSPVVLFSGSSGEYYDFNYTFVQCAAGSDHELDMASEWVQLYAEKHGGRIVTNFDEQRPMLADAPLSFQRLVKKNYERTIIEHLHFNGNKLADRIDQVVQEEVMSVNVTLGNGTVVHGDIVVANSIRDSFNRVNESMRNDELKEALQRLASQVGELIPHLDSEGAKRAADDLDTLTKEVSREQPRRQWWELSLNGLKEAATAVKEIGQPVLESVTFLLTNLPNLIK